MAVRLHGEDVGAAICIDERHRHLAVPIGARFPRRRFSPRVSSKRRGRSGPCSLRTARTPDWLQFLLAPVQGAYERNGDRYRARRPSSNRHGGVGYGRLPPSWCPRVAGGGPMGRGTRPAKAKIEAMPPVAGKPRKVDGSAGPPADERRAAVAQLGAITEVLRVISVSPSDVQPGGRRSRRTCGATVRSTPCARVARRWRCLAPYGRAVFRSTAHPRRTRFPSR